MIDDPNELLTEEASSAYRERNAWGRILPSSAWRDLAPDGRFAVFERQLENRLIEGALHPEGFSNTVRIVLEKIGGR